MSLRIRDENISFLYYYRIFSIYFRKAWDSNNFEYAETIEEVETLSLLDKEIELIKKALERSKGKRKLAADELGISERTLYRKIKQYDLQNQDD